MTPVVFNHFHLCCGLGGGAEGFDQAQARVGNLQARFRCIGGVDSDPAAIADFERRTGTKGTVMDLFDREQYIAWHGHEPPADWREALPVDLRRAAGNEHPHAIFTSSPCKGFSGLLAQVRSTSEKYQALNRLALRSIWLAMEAFKDDPPEFFIMENVPRIMTRGRYLLDQIIALLEYYGYAARETTHDCGELGGLAQSRRRFLLVARHVEKVPAFLYEPQKRPLASVGSVLSEFPLPGDIDAGGAMHRIPSLQWKTWVRLAFVEAGGDWRSLNRLAVEDGHLSDYLLLPDSNWGGGRLGVRGWDQAACTVAGESLPNNGSFAVADPRFDGECYRQYGVNRWDQSAGTVTGQRSPGQGPFSVADPRVPGTPYNHVYRIVKWAATAPAVTSANAGTAAAVADPRVWPDREHYTTGGHYGVVGWNGQSYAVSGRAKHDNGPWAVADPRALPAQDARLQALIIAEDNTWHRPFTTLELAALQGLLTPDDIYALSGTSDGAWRERIGNAVPPPAAAAIASVMGEALLLSMTGETFTLSSTDVWVRPVAASLSLPSAQ